MRCSSRTVWLAAMTAGALASFANSAAAQPIAAGRDGDAVVVEVTHGTAAFEVGTNIPAIDVHGKSTQLQGRARIRHTGEAIAIEMIEATLPVKTLSTGMGVRDGHMRKYIFTAADGQVPDVRFAGGTAECSPAASGGQSTCNVSGQLTIRGTQRPFAMTLQVTGTGGGYRAAGLGTVKLSAWGIAQPSQFGVTTTDDVKLRLEFTAGAVEHRAARPADVTR